MSDYKHEMGLRIKTQRKKMKFTQEEIAEQLGISVKHFSEVERGFAGLSIDNLIKLSNILNLSIDYIVKGEANKSEWESALLMLHKVPKGKEHLFKELIDLGIKLTND